MASNQSGVFWNFHPGIVADYGAGMAVKYYYLSVLARKKRFAMNFFDGEEIRGCSAKGEGRGQGTIPRSRCEEKPIPQSWCRGLPLGRD
jgi:hypothetical protein